MDDINCPKFDVRYEGIRRWLGPTETEIMEHFWEFGFATTTTYIHSKFESQALTTIASIITRLTQKRILVRSRHKVNNAWYYKPAMTREEFIDKHKSAVLDALENYD